MAHGSDDELDGRLRLGVRCDDGDGGGDNKFADTAHGERWVATGLGRRAFARLGCPEPKTHPENKKKAFKPNGYCENGESNETPKPKTTSPRKSHEHRSEPNLSLLTIHPRFLLKRELSRKG